MTLIKSISGIRGTIGGKPGEGLTPLDVVKFTSAFGTWVLKKKTTQKTKIVIGRDARISGEMVSKLVIGTLQGLGMDVVDLGLSTTPTVEIAVTEENADGGIVITASHNPAQWNALKLLNEKGEFISAMDGAEVLKIADGGNFTFAGVKALGKYMEDSTYIQKHIEKITALSLVETKAIKEAKFKIVIDAVNSTGGIAVPELLNALGVEEVIELYCEPNGIFPHNPEPLPENLSELSKQVLSNNAHLGFAVDPDVDRLAIVCENGEMFGEEYSLVAVADYVLKAPLGPPKKGGKQGKGKFSGGTVSNLSSTRALRDITGKAGFAYHASAVGEVNVVEMMKAQNAVIGGEGNGGIIFPELHYGRDALVGIALFLSHLAKSGKSCSELRATYPDYHISKNKIELADETDVDKILSKVREKYKKQPINTIDGIKIEFDRNWVHLRKSNTEPVIRIYAEAETAADANALANKIIGDIKEIIRQ